MADIIIGMIGFGTVGTGVAKILLKDRAMLEQRAGCAVELRRIVDLDVTTDRGVALPSGMLTANINDILADASINTVIEVIGGENPARKFIEAALEAGKNVVTSNKEVIAKHGRRFTEIAKANDCTILYEAAVGGGIPVLQAIRNSLSANTVERIYGIVNGTTNYILSKMTASGADFSETLKEAQALGYAEANPKNDVEGYDATYKLAILASLAFRCPVDYNEIYREGITNITSADIVAARQFGYAIKILAMGINHGDSIELRVHPVMVDASHPLATVSDVFNAIYIRGSSLGDSMLYGRGAGELPTASAVVGDVMNLAFRGKAGFERDTDFALNERKVMSINDCVTSFFVRSVVEDAPGVLANLANIFAKNSVSIESLQQMDAKEGSATITIITHPVAEAKMRSALHEIEGLSCVRKVASVIRVGLGECAEA
ncbi:MAG TPA: homoserine dehydrogenase [Treponemataceae bacterium]|nr:homoserine dehydrogenase [Treponemataceae bacterium]HPS43228.1 homoserine dehydrogenase [Treponemataceae bacterium]